MLTAGGAWHIALDWTEDEQRTLEDHLARFPPERYDALQRYVKLASLLPRKSVRDVALRCRWTLQQQMLKKRKLAEAGKGTMGVAKKGVGPGGKPMMPAPLPVPAVGMGMPGTVPPPFLPPGATPAQPSAVAEPGGMIVDGPIAQLLEANYGILNTFRANMSDFKVAENTQLLVQFRDNILAIIQHMEGMGGVMDQMPQLPVRLNTDLANTFLPARSFPGGGGGAGGSQPPQPGVNIPGMVPVNGLAPGAGTAAGAAPAAAAAATAAAAAAAARPPGAAALPRGAVPVGTAGAAGAAGAVKQEPPEVKQEEGGGQPAGSPAGGGGGSGGPLGGGGAPGAAAT